MGAAEMARAVFTEELSSSPGILGKLSQSPAPGAPEDRTRSPGILGHLHSTLSFGFFLSFVFLEDSLSL